MAGQGYVHLNGVTYELAHTLDDATAAQLRDRLVVGSGQQRLEVKLEKSTTTLIVDLAKVVTAAVWTRQPGTVQMF